MSFLTIFLISPEQIPVIIALAFLTLISIIDVKAKEIPSILTTSFIIMMFILNGMEGLYGAILYLLFALLIMECFEAGQNKNLFEGGADLKVMVALGFIMPNLFVMLVYLGFFAIIAVLYKAIIKLKYRDLKEVPFIPVFYITFIILIMGGLI